MGPDGSVWAATEEGVSRLREVGGTPTITNFTSLDGVPTPVHDVAVAGDGTVWLATDSGLYRLLRTGEWCGGWLSIAKGSRWQGLRSWWWGRLFGR